MQIFVKSLERTVSVHVNEHANVMDVKNAISAREYIPCEEQMLTFAGKPLRNEMSLLDLSVPENSTFHLSAALDGGAKKRKKKTYTTPKRIPHVRKKVPLAVLKYYRVEGDDKITRLRKECPNPECGAGVFMASHADRLYCGRCGLTLTRDEKE